MKRFYRNILCLMALAGVSTSSFAQSGSEINLGSSQQLLTEVKSQLGSPNQRTSDKPHLKLKAADGKTFEIKVNHKKSESGNHQYLVGQVVGHESGSFFLNIDGSNVEGSIILKEENKAFKYYSDENGNVYVKDEDVNNLLCVNYHQHPEESNSKALRTTAITAVPILESYPGANGCVLLDYDGHYVAGTYWNNGNPINAAPSGMSEAAIRESWEIVAEDFRPFSINVTTSEAVFNSYPKNRRMRCIITPTNTAAPGAGGVAYIGSFAWNDDTPCWTFITSAKGSAEASSHEIGHTFGLGHDGRTNPSEGYFAGHGDWAPIMGVGYYRNITQWSKGEYNNSNNKEDDLAKIASSQYGCGYRNDDHGNNTGSASTLKVEANGAASGYGIIERTTDVDFFRFTTGGGTVTLNVNTVSRHGNLDILVRLYNASGTQIGSYNPGGLNASLNVSLAAGTYYISVDGTGAGNPATDGYSDYASLGQYWISGTVPPGGTNPSSDGFITFYKDCNYSGTAVKLPAGDYTLSQLIARGISNDDISSIRVTPGWKVTVYWDDHFLGSSMLVTGDKSCLVADGWNDKISSLKIRPNGKTGLNGTYVIKNRNSGLVMDVDHWSTDNAATILQYNQHNGANQQFTFTDLGDGVYKIVNVNSGKAMDIKAFSTDNGARVEQYTYNGTPNQKFIVYQRPGGYYQIIPLHSGKAVRVSGNSTSTMAHLEQWQNDFQTSSEWTLVPVASNWSVTLQAENYSNMYGVQTEPTEDPSGGGSNVGWIDAGDWMAYSNINFPTSGAYRIEYRVAGFGGRLSADLNGGSIVLGAIDVPSTNGWQTWTTISHTVNINAGTYNFGIYAVTGGWNINWIKISKVNGARTVSTADDASTLAETLELYPNPATTEVFIKTNLRGNISGAVKVFNSVGHEVISNMSTTEDAIDISSLPRGIYTVQITVDGQQVFKRFVKE
ncbi:MAG TPA: carbohydrate-binding protein [Cytophagaceae bacterium]